MQLRHGSTSKPLSDGEGNVLQDEGEHLSWERGQGAGRGEGGRNGERGRWRGMQRHDQQMDDSRRFEN